MDNVEYIVSSRDICIQSIHKRIVESKEKNNVMCKNASPTFINIAYRIELLSTEAQDLTL